MSIHNKGKRAKKRMARIKSAKASAPAVVSADSDFVTLTDFDGFEVSGKPEFVALFKNCFVSPSVS